MSDNPYKSLSAEIERFKAAQEEVRSCPYPAKKNNLEEHAAWGKLYTDLGILAANSRIAEIAEAALGFCKAEQALQSADKSAAEMRLEQLAEGGGDDS